MKKLFLFTWLLMLSIAVMAQSFIVVDKDGNLCPLAQDQVFFEVSDGMEIVGVDNGCQFSMERFKDNKRKAFFGKCMVALKGIGKLKARAVGLEDAEMEIF